MPEPLALFPLNVVIVPGLVLPLHIFEPRYRAMVRDLLDKADPASREFGIATVREGRSFDSQGISALYPVGTATVLREVTELPDGRFDILTTGTRRFRLVDADRSADLAMASVEFLEESTEPGDELIAAQTAL
ncbi:MAG: LON peptidase substrate-binding domain-containing protein, partial [Actinomycetales bacterium]